MTRLLAALYLWLLFTEALFGQATNVFPSSGNVGIGTTSPQENLDIVGTARLNGSSGDTDFTINNAAPDAHVAVLSLSTPVRRWVWLTWNGANGGALPGSVAMVDGANDYARFFVSPNGTVLIGGNIDILDGSLSGSAMSVGVNGNVGIGTASPQYPLSVNGTIQAKEVIVNTGWSDYVFDPGYKLMPLPEVATYIEQHHHLPGVPSEAQVKQKGISLGEMQSTLLAKVEELTLHMIQMEHEDAELRKQNQMLQHRVARLEEKWHSSSKNIGTRAR